MCGCVLSICHGMVTMLTCGNTMAHHGLVVQLSPSLGLCHVEHGTCIHVCNKSSLCHRSAHSLYADGQQLKCKPPMCTDYLHRQTVHVISELRPPQTPSDQSSMLMMMAWLCRSARPVAPHVPHCPHSYCHASGSAVSAP